MSPPLFGHEQAIEFLKLYPDHIDALHGPPRIAAWSAMMHTLSPLIKLMLKDPAVEHDPRAEGKRVGILLWNNGIMEIARSRAQNHYARTFEKCAKTAQKAGRVKHALFYSSVAKEIRDPDQDEWVVVGEDDFM